MTEDTIHVYPGSQVEVSWDGRLCIHYAECVKAEGALFVTGRQPWCMPDLAEAGYVQEVVERCPSGALFCRDQDGRAMEQPRAENTLLVSHNGPYFLRGRLRIEGISQDLPGVQYRAALCRCGQSNFKPFCDGSHSRADFTDAGAIGTAVANTPAPQSAVLNVQYITDGPLYVTGYFVMLASSGRAAWAGAEATLCRCGHSRRKPFCDGSHAEVGFKAP